ncbi:MAG: hypothetical protein E7662_00870 [Ruminococcaceae bacterium]|nr:hypothetical protein [Oscillospiraceae bacterium]
MNEKNKSASNAAQKTNVKSSSPDVNTDSDLEIQELLRKYLPEFAESEEEVPASENPKKAQKPAPAEIVPEEEEEVIDEDYPEEDPPKKQGFFARLRSSRKKEEPAAPDSEIFDQISSAQEDSDENEDEDIKIAEEISEEAPREEIDPELLMALGLDDPSADKKESKEPEKSAEAEEDAVDPDELSPEEVDDTEQNLFVGWGMEDQLDKKAGVGTADKVAARNDAEAKEYEEQQRRVVEYEYTERSQTPKIAAAYKYSLTSLKIKMAAAAFLAVLAFFFENISIFGVQFAGALDPAVYPVVYIMVSLQIMLLACAVAYEQIFAGVRNLITGRPTPESVLAVLAVFGVLYSTIAAMLSVQGVEPPVYNFAVAACALMALVFSYLNTKREIFSFNIVSSKKQKFVFRRIPSSASSPESEAFGALDEDNPDVLQIEQADFVDGYFSRTTAILNSTRVYVTAMLTVITAAAVLLAIFAAVGGASAADAVSIAYVAILGAIPMSMFFTYSYPFYKANQDAYEMDSTIVGESSLEEYAGASIISFDDKNVFPSYGVKVQNIKIVGNNRIDRILYYAASVFSAAGGPLGDVFDVATIEMGHSDDVEILSAGVGYLEASVDGRSIVFGRSSVLTELGIELPAETVEEDSYIEGDLSIMYMVRDGKYVAKMYIKYIMDADFEFIVRQFANNGTCVCVKTLDPNIDEEMIFSKVKGKKYPLKVVKLHDGDADRERADSGIVTRGSTKGLLQVVSLCDTVLSVKRTNMIISIIAAIVTLTIMFIVSLSGNLSAIGSWLVVANQLFWMIPAALTTKLYIK